MGVDFETCETCGETTCDDNIIYMTLDGLGEYKTCRVCAKKHFTEVLESYHQYDILANESGYLFIAAPEGTETKETIKWESHSPQELLDAIEEAAVDPKSCLFDFGKVIPSGEEYCYGDGEYEICFGEAFDTFIADQKKHGKDPTEGYEKTWEPDWFWKKLMKERLDQKINRLQDKRRKLDQ